MEVVYPYGAAPHVAPLKPKKPKRYGWIALLVVFGVTVIGVATYVFLMRLSETVLTLLATIMVAMFAGAPGSILVIFTLIRRANGNGKHAAQPPQQQQPVVVMTPPMAWPQMQQQPQQPQATWEQAPRMARRYTVVGEEGEW